MSFSCFKTSGSIWWNYEVQKRSLSYVHGHLAHDQMMCLISLFLDQLQITNKVPF